MYKKAQNLVEVALLASVVVIIAITVIGIFNNQKKNLVGLSKSKINSQSVNLSTASSAKLAEKVPYNPTISTVSSQSLNLLGTTSSDYNSKMSNISYSSLASAMNGSDAQNLATLANQLIEEYNLSDPKISADNITTDTMNTLTNILNNITADSYKTDPNAQAFVQQLQSLINAANATTSQNGGS